MSATVVWHGDKLGDDLRRRATEAVQRAAALLVTRARLLCSTPAQRIRKRRVRDTSSRGGGRRGSQYTEFVASRPGQPPALRTGFGRRNIDMVFFASRLTARVGVRTNAAYMVYLELGTGRIAPRPWLKPALDQTRPAIDALLRTALKQ